MPPKKTPTKASRKKGQAPISYDLEIPIEAPAEQSLPDANSPPGTLKLKITATPNNWRDLYVELHGDPATLGSRLLQSIEGFYEQHIAPLDLPPPPRAKHTEAERAFKNESRRYVAACMAVLEHWERYSTLSWPPGLKKMYDSLPSSIPRLDGKTGKPSPLKVTRALWEKRFNSTTKDEDTFRTEYGSPSRNPYLNAARAYVKRQGDQTTVEDLEEALR